MTFITYTSICFAVTSDTQWIRQKRSGLVG